MPQPADGQDGHDTAKLMALLTQHQSPYLHASEVFADALARAKAQEKNVCLHFGAPWCVWCHRLEGWMARPEVAVLLDRDFVDLKIDQDRMIGAAELFKKYNPESKGGIPWFVVLSPSGEAIITSDGPDGNIGHPAKDEETRTSWPLRRAKSRKRSILGLLAVFVPSSMGNNSMVLIKKRFIQGVSI